MHRSLVPGLVSLGGLLLASTAGAAAVGLDFSGANDYSGNFRVLEREGSQVVPYNVNIGQDAGGYIRASTNGSSRITVLYDATPASAAVKSTFALGSTFEFDARIPAAGRSVGIYLVNAGTGVAAENSAYLALFNVDDSAVSGSDRLRFSPNADPSSSTNNAAGLGNQTSGDAGYAASTTGFVHVKLVYTADAGNHPVLDFTVGSLHATQTYTTATAFSDVEVGWRLSPSNVAADVTAGKTYIDIDNVSITSVPEPASMALATVATGALLLRRRKH